MNASLRPSGMSYRDRLINREVNKNPSELIDKLLEQNNGFLVFQEDVIAFLQQICGLSGSEADNVRRAIGRKDIKRLEKALPSILDGYCGKSSKPRATAEQEAKEFLQIMEDASDYMFGFNHSTGYSMVGYTCGFLRYHYPLEFITAFLNNSDNEEDTRSGVELAKLKNIKIINPKFRYSSAFHTPHKESSSIFKGVASVKYLNQTVAEQLYSLRHKKYDDFIDLLVDLVENTAIDTRQLEILILIDFFSEFGNNNRLISIYNKFIERYKKTYVEKTKEKRIAEIREYANTTTNIKPFTPDIDMKHQILYLGYTQIVFPNIPLSYYMVVDITKKYTHPMIKLYRLNDGLIETIKVKVQKYEADKFNQFDIINMTEKKQEYRWALNPNGDGFVRTNELEWIMRKWSIVK